MELPSVPFSFVNVYEGLAKAHGMARITSGGLTLEFEVKDGFVGMLKTGVRHVLISFDDMSDIDLQKGWFKTKLCIRTRSMVAINQLPGTHAGRIELRIAREDRQIAEALASTLMLSISQRTLERVSGPE
jgi:hypothetical protein